MRHALVTTLENTPVIPAVKTPEELPRGAARRGGRGVSAVWRYSEHR